MAEHPFEKFSRDYRVTDEARGEESFEEQVVDFTLKACGLSKAARDVRQADDAGRLTCRAFNDVFPTFPMLLATSRKVGRDLHTNPKAFLPAMFKRFDAVPFVAAYEQVFDVMVPRAHGRAVALVFFRKGFRKGLVIYDDGFDLPAYHGLSLMYTSGGQKPVRLLVRPYQEVVAALYHKGHGWRP